MQNLANQAGHTVKVVNLVRPGTGLDFYEGVARQYIAETHGNDRGFVYANGYSSKQCRTGCSRHSFVSISDQTNYA